MKPAFLGTDCFEAIATKRTTGWGPFRKRVFKVRIRQGFALRDSSGICWRPVLRNGQTQYASDGATVPWPLNRLFAGDPLHFQFSAMGIHDPCCNTGYLEALHPGSTMWVVVRVTRSQADDLLSQGIIAEDGLRITSTAYWLGVRIGAALGVGVRKPKRPKTT